MLLPPPDKFQQYVRCRCWLAGLKLKEAYQRINNPKIREYANIPDMPDIKHALIREWRLLYKHCRNRSLTWEELGERRPRPKTEEEWQEELHQEITKGVTYGTWLGVTGPGKQFRDILKAEQGERNAQKNTSQSELE